MRYEKGTPEGNGCIIDIDVDGQGQEARIAPGKQVTITFDFTIWRIPTRRPIQQIVAGIGEEPVFGCLYDDIAPIYPGVTVRKTLGFVSAEPGVFEICVSKHTEYTCQDALNYYPNARKVAATIEVSPTAPEMHAAMIIGPALIGMATLTQIEGEVI